MKLYKLLYCIAYTLILKYVKYVQLWFTHASGNGNCEKLTTLT